MLKRTFAFAAVSGLILLLAAVVLSYLHRSYAEHELERMAERNNLGLTRVFMNTLWFDIRDYARASEGMTPAAMQARPEVAVLHARMANVMHGSSIAEVTIYDLDGRVVYSTDAEEIGVAKPGARGFLEARSGRVASETVWKDHVDTLEGVISNRNVVSSYIPLADPADPGRVVAVFEVYDDVTDILAELDHNHRRIMVVVGGVMLLVYAGLILVVHQSYRAVAQEHATTLRLSAAVARSEAASQAKSAFMTNMSHELRTPLNAVIGFAQIMKEEMLGPVGVPEYREYARDIHDAGQHLLGIVNDILDMTKAESGKLVLRLDDIDVADVIGQVERMVRQEAAARGLTLTVDVEPGTDPIRSDPTRLRQVLLNLLSNAIKFTPSGGSVGIAMRRQEEKVVIEVADTGIGIAPDDLPKAMAPFGQVDSSLARKYDGTGLGLPLAKRLTEALGGSIDIESRLGHGTRVRITHPVWAPGGDASPA